MAGCQTPHAGAKLDEMTVEQHERAAAEHWGAALEQQRRYAENARAVGSSGARTGSTSGYVWPVERYNPTETHLRLAERERTHANEHLAAAATLRAFEESECGSFPPETRASCPIVGPLVSVQEIVGGVRLTFEPGAPVAAVLAHIRCHLAYGRAHGYEDMGECPVYLPGLRAGLSPDGAGLDVTGEDMAIVAELRKRAQRLPLVSPTNLLRASPGLPGPPRPFGP